MTNCMNFPDDWREFLKSYSFKDTEELYTNGSELIPVFRVEQLIEHLLKAQEPRVLTLEELRSLNGTDHFVWLEDNGEYDLYDCYAEVTTYQNNVELNTFGREVEFEPDNEEYGKTWRCWTAKPTKEQREATPWEN